LLEEEKKPRRLTPRELEVLSWLCDGCSNKTICAGLNISMGTVKSHVGQVLRKLGASSRLQAVLAARDRGLVVNVQS